MKIKEIIVVEGRDDTVKIHLAVDADTIETNGSAINQTTLNQIRHAQEKRGVIVFTDPDYPGQRIRSIINEHVPGCKHAFLTREHARSKNNKGSIGIEHASIASIQKALGEVHELTNHHETDIHKKDLLNYGLIGGPRASYRRDKLGEALQIGHTNGKQLLKRLSMFQITYKDFEQAIQQVLQEENNDH
ncbi:ribonuclease M5 [Virgibacillus phasianinus]|uniref:Ribonuclease M5 n=1 Tax=Virgibacillus phasianinus TaxID=2017483 RepID=A0A220U1I8_9BACI|nr:ribonuclease M5 [Virgibacillus phasianinus]ASK61721.1 ribonuclease M5 [Virgibacillus phasianinus]